MDTLFVKDVDIFVALIGYKRTDQVQDALLYEVVFGILGGAVQPLDGVVKELLI